MRDEIARPGHDGSYGEATFFVFSDGIPLFKVLIYVHPAWPTGEVEKVAQCFLAARLTEAISVIDVYTPAELEDLSGKIKPDDNEITSDFNEVPNQ